MALPAHGVAPVAVARGLAALLGASVLLGCRGGAADLPERTVTIAYPRGLSSPQPNRDIEEFSLSILGNLFEGLVEIDENLALRPALAESWASPDDLTWIFRLRPGVRFHDGAPVAAGDVVRCLERLRRDPTHELAPTLAEVAEIAAEDPLTIRLRTRYPVPSLPYHLASLFVWRDGAVPERPIGTGPFVLAAWTPATGDAELRAFPAYWGGAPAIDRLRFRALPRPADRVAALRAGSADLAVDVPAPSLPELARLPGLRTVSARGLRVVLLGLVLAPGTPAERPLADPRVRRAVALAIDRARLAREALGGHADVVDQILAPEVFGYASDLPRLPYDPAAARELLRAAGYGGGFDLALDFPRERYRAIEAVAARLAEDLQAVGIRVALRGGTSEEFFARLARHEPQSYLLGWISGGDAPLSYAYLLHRPGAGQGSDNYTGFADPAFDQLLEQTELEPSTAQRGVRLRELAAWVQRELPLVPLYRQHDLYALRADLDFTPRADRRIRGVALRWGSGPAAAAHRRR